MFRLFFKLCLFLNFVSIIAFVYALQTKPISKVKGKRFRILALNHNRFTQDLELLEKTGEYKVYKIPFHWQSRFLNFFYNTFDRSNIGLKRINKKKQKIFRVFLENFLKRYYSILKINCVVGAAIHYKQDIDWGAVSKIVGIPYIVLHKENMYASEGHIANFKKKIKYRQKFEGSHIVVHNKIVKKTFLESNIVNKDDITVGGCMRMDQFVNCSEMDDSLYDLVLFSFGPGVGLSSINQVQMFPEEQSIGFHKLSEKTHLEVIIFAKNNPQKKVLIKPKWGGKWLKFIDNISKKNNINLEKIKNLVIDHKCDTHEIIKGSKVFVGFNSTTLLEAAIKNKYVIIPLFEEASYTKFKNFIFFKKYLHYFHTAKSKKQLNFLIKKGLENKDDLTDILNFRKQIFNDYVSPIAGSSINIYSQKISKLITNNSIYKEKK